MSGSNQGWALGLGTSLVLGGLVLFGGDYAKAQITPDDTLGNEASVVKPNVDIKGQTSDLIEGGATRGPNLFHSFLEFNVGEGRGAYFANPDGIQNILGRVTGTDPSDILGTFGVQGNANLFLLNPNGIIFGPNARLDVSGSFVASTADSLELGNGEKFSATNPEAPPLLTINVTPGLQYGANQPGGTIANTGNLAVGQDLTLVAGNLDLQGQLYAGRNLTLLATDTVQVRDSVANPFIASAGEQLLVQGNQRVDIFALNHPDSGLFSGRDMVLRSANTVGGDAHYWSGGNFRIEQLEGSLGDLESPNDPVIRASGDVNFNSYSGASLHILAGGSVTIGTVEITGEDVTNGLNETVTLSDGTSLEIKGNTHPTLDIRAGTTAIASPGITDTIPPAGSFSPPEPNTNALATSADITIGSISNEGGVVFLTNQYYPNTSLPGGVIQVGKIDTSNYLSNALINGGSVVIDSRSSINLTGEVNSSTGASYRNGGNITLIANDDITTASLYSASIDVDTSLKGGDIRLTSRNGAINTAGVLSSISFNGTSGNIILTANGSITTTQRLSSVSTDGTSGNITLTANGSITAAQNLSSLSINGTGGKITLTANGNITTGSVISASPSGNSGDIYFNSENGAVNTIAGILNSNSFGKSGSITLIAATDLITGDINSTSIVGNGGNISLRSNQGLINTTLGSINSPSTLGRGGNITLIANDNITTQQINSYSFLSEGGDISLNSSNGAINATKGGLFSSSFHIDSTSGDITFTAKSNITTGSVSTASPGNGGNIRFISDEGAINTTAGDVISSSFNQIGGNVTFNANENIILRNIDASGVRLGGNISLRSNNDVLHTNGGIVSTASGNIAIDARNLKLAGGSRLEAGRTEVQLGSVNSSSGNIEINVTEAVNLADKSAIANLIQPGAEGKGGNIKITASSFSATNGSQLATSTLGEGPAGSVTLSASTISFENESGVLTSVEPGAKGNGGEIYIKATSLLMSNGSQLQASTKGEGNAGNVTLEVAEGISFTGSKNGFSSGVTSTSELGAVGNSSNITINTRQLDIQDGGAVTVSSAGGGKAGNIGITAENIFLNTGGAIAATTQSIFDGGNIKLQVWDSIVMRRESKISTSAGTAQTGGNGGNITIDAQNGFIVGVSRENSDITANAFEGKGGKVNITTQRIFGLKERPELTDKSDITASSELGLNGEIRISELAINPNNGLASLPGEPLPEVIEPKCQVGSRPGSNKFTVIGRGGLPSNPTQTFGYNRGWVDIRSETPGTENSSSSPVDIKPTRSAPKQIVEAQGWIINDKGQVELVAVAPQATLSQQTPVACDSQSEKVAQN